jgi:hypothetical protein
MVLTLLNKITKNRQNKLVALKRAVWVVLIIKIANNLMYSLSAFTNGVFGQLTRQQQSHTSLDFPASDGATLVIVSQPAGLVGNSFKDIIDKRVHNAHGLSRNPRIRVYLAKNFIDVDGIALLPPALSLLILILLCFLYSSTVELESKMERACR